jgi:pimeloyl-ACP methyl ester carboxylesterase
MVSNHALAELVNVRTEDGVLLHGALFEPETRGTLATLLTHGGWGNFYTGLARFLPSALVENGVTCLSVNNRGHDYGTVADGEPCIGLLREQFEDSPKDISAWTRFLKKRGYSRLVLIGHSYGATKVAYSQFVEPNPNVVALILCTPATLMRDAWKYYLDVPYDEAVLHATRLVTTGKGESFVIFRQNGPVPLISTARTFLSVWGPDPATDFCKFIDEIAKPILVTVGENDKMCIDYSRTVYEHAGLAKPRKYVVIPLGDHYYRGAELSLERAISDWLRRLGLM